MPDPGAARSFWLQEALGATPANRARPSRRTWPPTSASSAGGSPGSGRRSSSRPANPRCASRCSSRTSAAAAPAGATVASSPRPGGTSQAMCGLFGDDEGLRYAHAVVGHGRSRSGRGSRDHDVDAWFHHDGVLGIRDGRPGRRGPVARGPRRSWRRVDSAIGCDRSPWSRLARSPTRPGSRVLGSSMTARSCSRPVWPVACDASPWSAVFASSNARTVTGLDRSRPAVVRTEHGAVKADQVVLAIGAWAAGWPGFRRSFGVIADHMVVTEPIPELLARDRLDLVRGHRRRPGSPLLPAAHRRRSHRDRWRWPGRSCSAAVQPDAARPTTVASPTSRLAGSCGCSRSWRASGSRTPGAGRSTRRRRSCRSTKTLEPGNVHAGLGFSGHGLSQTMVGSPHPGVDGAGR